MLDVQFSRISLVGSLASRKLGFSMNALCLCGGICGVGWAVLMVEGFPSSDLLHLLLPSAPELLQPLQDTQLKAVV